MSRRDISDSDLQGLDASYRMRTLVRDWANTPREEEADLGILIFLCIFVVICAPFILAAVFYVTGWAK